MTVHSNIQPVAETANPSREQWILDIVRGRGLVDIAELASRSGVTPQTIRRGVNRLSERGLVRRVHGGVTLPPAGVNLPWETRQVSQLEGKRRIAAVAAAMIPHGASVSIGLGTTPHQVALALRSHQGLRVVTNSLRVVFALAGAPGLEIAVAGGFLRPADLDVVGEAAVRCFAGFRTDFAVFGVGGIDDDGALLDFDPAEVAAREAMRAHCRQSLLVADVTKFGRPALARGGSLGEIDHLILDAAPPQQAAALLAGGSPRLHVGLEEGA